MSDGVTKHAFVSYVREDSAKVDQLCRLLDAAEVPYWRDRESLAPGDAWKAKIREAIQTDSLAFLACFSAQSQARDRSMMNEELTLAVEEYRKLTPGKTWLIPVRLDDVSLPDWDLGAGRVLSDLNYVDLFGEDYTANATALITTIRKALGRQAWSTEAAATVLSHASDQERPVVVERLTKEMISDPKRRIELNDLVAAEARSALDSLNDESQFPRTLAGADDEEKILRAVAAAEDSWTAVEPFCRSLRVATRWAQPDDLAPWAMALQGLVAVANRPRSGNTIALSLLHLPGLACLMTTGVAAVSARQYGNLRTLAVDAMTAPKYDQNRWPLVAVTDPSSASDGHNIVVNVLARSRALGESHEESLKHFRAANGKYYAPVSEWLHAVLGPMFGDLFYDSEDYDLEFDRAEVLLGALATDFFVHEANRKGVRLASATGWFGRATWRSRNRSSNPLDDFTDELENAGSSWAPLRAGLFGADPNRAHQALEKYGETFRAVAARQF